MTNKNTIDGKKVAPDFGAVAISKNVAVIELVRHLARIAAENDYRDFLNKTEIRYNGPQQKGPPL